MKVLTFPKPISATHFFSWCFKRRLSHLQILSNKTWKVTLKKEKKQGKKKGPEPLHESEGSIY